MLFFTTAIFLGLASAGLFGPTSNTLQQFVAYVGGTVVIVFLVGNIYTALKITNSDLAELIKSSKKKNTPD